MRKHTSGGHVCGFVICAEFSIQLPAVICLMSRSFFIIIGSSLVLLLKKHTHLVLNSKYRFVMRKAFRLSDEILFFHSITSCNRVVARFVHSDSQNYRANVDEIHDLLHEATYPRSKRCLKYRIFQNQLSIDI